MRMASVLVLGLATVAGCVSERSEGEGGDADKRLDALESSVEEIEDNNTEEALAAILADVAQLRADVDQINGEVDGLGTSLSGLSATVGGIQTDVGNLQSGQNSHDGRLDVLESDVGVNQSAIVSLDDDLQDSKVAAKTVNFTTFKNLSGSDTAVRSMGSMTVSVPASGRLVVILHGETTRGGQNRTVTVGIGDTSTSFDFDMEVGHLDGSSTLRAKDSFTVAGVFAVSAGNRTFHALYQGNTVFDAHSINVIPQSMTAIWVPEAL